MNFPSSSPEQTAVLEANQGFYDAFEAMDFEAMSAVWSRRPEDICVHPGWPFLRGWREVRESWRAIFANTGFMRISITDLTIEVRGEMARVCCVENLYSVFEDQTVASQVAATNVFVLHNGRWRMTLHHGSSIASRSVAEAPSHNVN